MTRATAVWVAAIAASALVLASVALGWADRSGPARCPAGLVAVGSRCCGSGQTLEASACAGEARSCAETQRLDDGRCHSSQSQISLHAVDVRLLVDDWDLASKAPQHYRVTVPAAAIDRTEVTYAQWADCVQRGICQHLPSAEPQRPVVNVTPQQAETYCQFRGGQLPSSEQWLAAAAGAAGRRYPWGASGLVCRRSTFGIVEGPCAHGGHTAEVPGSRPDGATPDGVLDLSGNVAEWTRDSDERWVARGGSFRSTLASELKTLSFVRVDGPRDDIGFRCVYAQ